MQRETQLSILKQAMDKIGLVLSQVQYDQLIDYYEILIETNKVMNLTAITEFTQVVEKHFVDSLIFSEKLVQNNKKISLIDVGTGAGFPGIPLKIVYPSMNVTLMDSLAKRIGFLQKVIEELKLENIIAVHKRAEDAGMDSEYREKFDCCVSRAVANLATLSEYCIPLVKTGGYFIPYKSGEIEEELEQSKKALRILGGRVEEVKKFQLPDSDMGRSLIYIKKNFMTNKKYPRKAGMPKKEPLLGA